MHENCILVPEAGHVEWLLGRSRFLGINGDGNAVVISLCRKNNGPQEFSLEEIQRALDAKLLRIEKPEETKPPHRHPSDLSPKAKTVFEFWKPFVSPLLHGNARRQLLDQRARATLIQTLASETKKPEITVRRLLYRVLRCGISLLGLCPDFFLRGGPGKCQTKGSAKRGRKARDGAITSAMPLPDVRNALEDAVRQYIVKDGQSIPVAYSKMIAEKFVEVVVEPNGRVVRKEMDESRLPTMEQLRYVARQSTQRHAVKVIRPSRGGKATDGVPGPGFIYEIDATGGRLELVSEFDLKQPIGSADAYGVLDVWSTACVGGVMGVFHAGYQAAQRALFNTFTNKRELCARWDIEITEEMWPCSHIPRYLVSDRGELVSDAAEALPEELNIDLRTPPPYVPQLKGTVEGWFCQLKASDIRKLVGFGRRPERGERDPRDQAALTRYDAMRAFLLLAIQYNSLPAPVSSIPPQMIEDGFEKISRITLSQWGERNLVTGARIEDPQLIYTSLLQKVDASIREDGLYVKGVRYISPALRDSGALRRAAERGAIDVQATIDEFAAQVVWFRMDLDQAWLPAYLADEKLKAYCATFTELAEYYRRRKTIAHRTRVGSAVFENFITQQLTAISDNAVARQGGKPRKGHDRGKVRESRAVDAQDERQQHGTQVVGSYLKDHSAPKKERTPERRNAAADRQLALVRSAFLKTGTH